MRELRSHIRLPYDAEGILDVAGSKTAVTTVNISKGGACLRLDPDAWAQIEEDATVKGCLVVDGEDFNFEGRVCWSSAAEAAVHFGLEFLDYDRHIIEAALERLSVVEHQHGDTFNI